MIDAINEAWGWAGIVAKETIAINDFGNIVFQSVEGEYWRLCPEELSDEKIADDDESWLSLKSDPEFMIDWEMTRLVEAAHENLGALAKGEKYCLKYPAVLGGAYEDENIGKISFLELISCSGDLAEQIRFLEDGEKVILTTTNLESLKRD